MTNETSEVMALLRLFEQSDFTALHVETAGLSLSVAKDGADPAALITVPAGAPAAPALTPKGEVPPQPAATARAPAASTVAVPAASNKVAEAVHEGDTIMRSPMLGTFYRAPAPDEPPYVNVGDAVKRGQVLCMIECMKLFNTIEAEADGVVASIDVANGEMVEFGQSLIRISAT